LFPSFFSLPCLPLCFNSVSTSLIISDVMNILFLLLILSPSPYVHLLLFHLRKYKATSRRMRLAGHVALMEIRVEFCFEVRNRG
jgi:hypothetical protein